MNVLQFINYRMEKTAASKSRLAIAEEMIKSTDPILKRRGEKILAQHKHGKRGAKSLSQAIDINVAAYPNYESVPANKLKRVRKLRIRALESIRRGQNPKGFVNIKPRMSAAERKAKVNKYITTESEARIKRKLR